VASQTSANNRYSYAVMLGNSRYIPVTISVITRAKSPIFDLTFDSALQLDTSTPMGVLSSLISVSSVICISRWPCDIVTNVLQHVYSLLIATLYWDFIACQCRKVNYYARL